MDISTIVSLIGSLGFPIVCCIIMFKQMEKDRERNGELREADRIAHAAEMDKVTTALNNNTLVMQKLIDALSSTNTDGKHS